ncbi:hypothetical protein SUGI_0967630 [Cryptomeria japonica]|uniref:flowering-promoting factor 1-like protein 1 n=1 Tax=Cryptomeria japonica TaxID=3369 RepID=UPI002414844F|nr:flowering-promoting factor 1-like protein 1 [Cryptomeria japonica]GLJ45954.1 hypothetical protein SUGI_0967630 [Cryptomeria japonica]
MSGVWVFSNGVARLVSNPMAEPLDGSMEVTRSKRKVLVYTPTNEVITNYAALERKLLPLGWERYNEDSEVLQYHKTCSVHLISLPRDFSKFKSIHMFDIVVKNRNAFEVRDMYI